MNVEKLPSVKPLEKLLEIAENRSSDKYLDYILILIFTILICAIAIVIGIVLFAETRHVADFLWALLVSGIIFCILGFPAIICMRIENSIKCSSRQAVVELENYWKKCFGETKDPRGTKNWELLLVACKKVNLEISYRGGAKIVGIEVTKVGEKFTGTLSFK